MHGNAGSSLSRFTGVYLVFAAFQTRMAHFCFCLVRKEKMKKYPKCQPSCFKGSKTSCDVIISGVLQNIFCPTKITSRDGCFLLNIG